MLDSVSDTIVATGYQWLRSDSECPALTAGGESDGAAKLQLHCKSNTTVTSKRKIRPDGSTLASLHVKEATHTGCVFVRCKPKWHKCFLAHWLFCKVT